MSKKHLINWYESIQKLPEIKKALEGFREFRYNGGWTKTVTGLDKTVATGYSIQGEFIKTGNYKEYYEDGLYLDCDIRGSRKNQSRNYTLIRIQDGIMKVIQYLGNGGRDWATEFWDNIEKELNLPLPDYQGVKENLIEHLKMYDVNPKQRSEIADRMIEVIEKHTDHIGTITDNMVFDLLEEGVGDSEALNRINGFTDGLAQDIYKQYKRYKDDE